MLSKLWEGNGPLLSRRTPPIENEQVVIPDEVSLSNGDPRSIHWIDRLGGSFGSLGRDDRCNCLMLTHSAQALRPPSHVCRMSEERQPLGPEKFNMRLPCTRWL